MGRVGLVADHLRAMKADHGLDLLWEGACCTQDVSSTHAVANGGNWNRRKVLVRAQVLKQVGGVLDDIGIAEFNQVGKHFLPVLEGQGVDRDHLLL